jgi:integrase/recombinase XerC
VALLLANKRSPATQRAYRADLCDFFGKEPSPAEVQQFISLPTSELALRLNHYKADLLSRGVAEATINRCLAAIRALLKFCHRLGYAQSDGRGLVDSEKVRTYRDTRGVDVRTLQRLVAAPGTETLAGLRDTAILRLLCENALRRADLCSASVGDFSLPERRLLILGKGRGTQKEPVTLSRATAEAIAAYLDRADHAGDAEAPLFRNLDHRPNHKGERLTPQGLYWLVGRHGEQVGVSGLAPHKLRHSAITAALDATGGDVRRVQRLSRHANLETLQRYDDNRNDLQGEVTRTLAALIGD